MTVKDELRRIVDELPDDCTFEDVQYKLYVLEKVRKGLEQIDRGETVPHEEVLQRLRKWQDE
jgi:predicted transcriptional regulator